MTTHQEFVVACELLQACISNLRCGVHIESGTEPYIETLKRLAREYREAYTQSNRY